MKVVLDTMLWVSYCTRRNGSRHRLIDQALKSRVRLFVSDYILDELADVLRDEMSESARYVHLARRAILRRAKRVDLPENIRSFVPRDPKDDAVVQTAISAKADYLVTITWRPSGQGLVAGGLHLVRRDETAPAQGGAHGRSPLRSGRLPRLAARMTAA